MRTGRPKADLVLSNEERSQLVSFARSRSLPAALSSRARIVLSSADGEANLSIAQRLKLTNATVGKWRKRFVERRIAGLYDDVRPGKPRTIDDERVAQLIKTTLHTKPAEGSTHWSVRTVAAETGISKTSVQRYFQLFGLQPHHTESFKLSNDPFVIEKLRDVVGLYLSPPDNALVICVDEKSQSLPSRDIGEIRYPELFGPIRLELTLDPVLWTGRLPVNDRGAHHLAAARALQHQAFHQTLHRAAGNAKTFALHLLPDFVCTVDLFVGLPDALDVSNQRLVTLGTRAAQLGVALMGCVAPIA